jgi:hypothetical protein
VLIRKLSRGAHRQKMGAPNMKYMITPNMRYMITEWTKTAA